MAAALAVFAPATAFAADFNLVGQFGGSGSGSGQFFNVSNLALDSGNNVFVADPGNARIQRFTAGGAFSLAWGTAGQNKGQFSSPTGVDVDPAGNVYVADRGNHRVQKFNSSGVFERTWGSSVTNSSSGAPETCLAAATICFGGTPGTDPGEFSAPEAVAIDGAGNVFVSEFFGNRVQKFTPAGAPLAAWGSPGAAAGQFARPVGLAVNSSGEVYVADRDNNRVQRFSNTGAFLGSFGGQGVANGQMAGPEDVTVEPSGNVLVADLSNRRVQRFSRTGTFLANFNRVLPSPVTFRPESVEVTPAGDMYVIDGAGTNRVLRVREAAAAGLPAPVLGKTVNVRVVSGRVTIGVRGGGSGARASQKGVRFVPLSQARSIPVGSFINTRKGKVRLTSAQNTKGKTQTGDFYSGLFQVIQSRKKSARGLTELRLKGSSFKRCTARRSGKRAQAAARRRLSKRAIRRLRSKATGRFRTRGRHSSATVRGTSWLTTDRCDGTLTKVTRGKVSVRDFRRKRTITLRRGKSYLARARR